MEERAKIPPGLPHPNPTVSYWQDSPSSIADHRTTPSLPNKADYVIVGSGISGAFIAYNLLETHPEASIVMLEARQACSGATGRNGGHTKAASYRSFLHHETEFGTDEAVRIARLEYANIMATHAFAKEQGIECDSRLCDTADVIYSAAHWEEGKRAIERMREVMGAEDPAAKYEIFDAKETEEKFFCPGAIGAFTYQAGSLSAYAFATGVLKLCLERGLNLLTNTPALSVSPAPSTSDPQLWTTWTPRGAIKAPNLILATNGYTPHLLPQLQGLIVPLHGQITAQRPGTALPPLNTTYSFIYTTGYEYAISRPPSTSDAGTILIGGGLGILPAHGACQYGNTDDSALNPDLSSYLYSSASSRFAGYWGDDDAAGRIKREWSGVMGATADGLPYVGAVPGEKGLWVCAGFNGHGMVLCLKCAEAVVGMMEGRVMEWFPDVMSVGSMGGERLGRKFEGRVDMKMPKALAPGEAMFGESEAKAEGSKEI
ncbi:hypothetical protein M8818_006794 [Zalaria obscura]|uniref:Uncharacterized protein n=1 Tax=Zalaria obscura TaxID=2024903 RepID=A0ACC3S5I2_9PEZI